MVLCPVFLVCGIPRSSIAELRLQLEGVVQSASVLWVAAALAISKGPANGLWISSRKSIPT
jgi:hypothetical protein